ncbi:cysteine-rich receptor-like protein kinase 10 [Nymphaea colorata]|nr:cysteine-rich receptor-like protein kinase 10 [Nymphaea colorata]
MRFLQTNLQSAKMKKKKEKGAPRVGAGNFSTVTELKYFPSVGYTVLDIVVDCFPSVSIVDVVALLDNSCFAGDPSKRTEFTWEQLYRIITRVARGLVYLYEDSRLTVIHRDVKPSNILLDDNMNPKIADFGLARLLLIDQTHQDTSKVVGTYGYMSPEYAMHGKFSVKSDVYSFGVLLLEIVSGKRNMAFQELGDQDLLSYTWILWSEGRALELVDPKQLESCPRAEILRCIHIGLLCVQEDPDDRPTMSSILLMLNSTSATLQKPSSPALVLDRSRGLWILNASSSDILEYESKASDD